ncbi:MAG: hypothetical protein RL477_867 [Pseudomonadota bacterium]|jgi:chromate transporter
MSSTAESAAPDRPPHVSLAAIFMLFFRIGVLSFGGGLLGWLHREVVEKRAWLKDMDFLGGLTLAQVMPGINVTNLGIYIGSRLRGAPGAAAAVVGILSGPFVICIGMAMVYAELQRIKGAPEFMVGVAAAAVGLFLSVGVKSIRKNIRGWQYVILLAIVGLVGIQRVPMVPVVLVLAPLSVALAWFTRDKAKGAAPDA